MVIEGWNEEGHIIGIEVYKASKQTNQEKKKKNGCVHRVGATGIWENTYHKADSIIAEMYF